MRSSLRFSISLAFVLALGGAITGCGDDDDTDENAQTGSDASVSESGSGGRASAAGRSGSGGSRPTAGRSGSAGATGAAGEGGASGSRAGTGGTGGRANAGGTSATAGVGGSAAAGVGGATASARLSDGQIAAVTTAANTGEIQLGTLALSRARIPEVRFFAQEMIQAHGAAQDRSSQLLQTLNLVPIQNELSTQVEVDAQRVATTLQSTPAATFDLVYVQSQIDMHVQVLKLFDERLLPSVTEVALRTDLTLARGDVQRHLTEAQALLVIVQAAPPDADAGTEDAGL